MDNYMYLYIMKINKIVVTESRPQARALAFFIHFNGKIDSQWTNPSLNTREEVRSRILILLETASDRGQACTMTWLVES